jgi:nucleosome binding factor SPN SPT16 subunit
MLGMLENDFVGFPQSNIDELYVKYGFNEIKELPEDEDSLETDDHEVILKSSIELFTENYESVKKYINDIINANGDLIGLISKKPMTHVYSLWTLIAFNLDKEINISDVSDRFAKLLEKCQEFEKSQDPSEFLGDLAYTYFMSTKGAATEKKHKKIRHDALMEFIGWKVGV